MPKQQLQSSGYISSKYTGAAGGKAKAATMARRAIIAAKQAASRARTAIGGGAAQASGARRGKRARSAPASDSDSDSDASDASDASIGWGGEVEDEGADGADAALLPSRVRRSRALITDLHRLDPQLRCPHACGALVWPGEGTVCCSAGKHILGPTYNPPIDSAYLDFLKMEHISNDSRLLNANLAMGTQGVFPSRAQGGLTWHDQGRWSFVALHGKSYFVMHGLGSNNAFDTYLLPKDLLLDGATVDLGVHYAARLQRARAYLAEHHPLARHLCTIADVPVPEIDLSPYMRLEAHSLRTNAMELAMVSSGVQGAADRSKTVYFVP